MVNDHLTISAFANWAMGRFWTKDGLHFINATQFVFIANVSTTIAEGIEEVGLRSCVPGG